MELFEHSTKETLRREAAAARLRDLADQLERHNQVTFLRDGLRFVVEVPDEVELKVEVEIDGDESEIEVEISW
jgi:amphi-Trp domain-containing protein